MKWHLLRQVSFLLCFILSICPTRAYADQFGFNTIALPDNVQLEYFDNLNVVPLEKEQDKLPVVCFDVNSSGMYALGHGNSLKKTICVYDANNEFLSGFEFNYTGIYEIDLLDNGDISIYLNRSYLVVTLDTKARCINIVEIPLDHANLKQINSVIDVTSKTVNGCTYFLAQNGRGSQLIKEDPYGEQVVLYDATMPYLSISVLCLFTIAGILFISMRRQKYKQSESK